MFEHRKSPLLQPSHFVRRLLLSIALGVLVVFVMLLVGMCGYHFIEGLSWVDAYLESAMIFAGMGPTATLHTTAGKLFGGSYALVSAFALLLPVTIVLLPLLHRFLHKFHLEDKTSD